MKTLIAYALICIVIAAVAWLLLSEAMRVQAGDDPVCGFVYDLSQPQVEAPCEMAEDADEVFMECEVKGYWSKVGRPSEMVGGLGERGMAQIHPANAGWMRRLGWDFYSEKDRLEFAVYYWGLAGWGPWSCAR